uniref:Carboxylesterase type B domain-containing protein n=1 Tax=Rhodnius prolixus TaxID=13249 RepID=T1I1U5_RHOPR
MDSFTIVIKLVLLVRFAQCIELTVNTTCGSLRGTEFTSRNGRIVAAFHGVPFAKPPVGDLRFQDPQPPEPWPGVREAYNFGSVCVQIPFFYPPVNTTKLGNEDCLYLSVYSPKLKPSNLMPVVVHLNGGEMYSGSGEVDKSPEYFLDYDIVVVMPNFRIGVFGFLTLEDDIMPGNMALKDQVMALVWIQNNIASFGGDPNQVTLLGDTTGAALVHYHMYSPMSKADPVIVFAPICDKDAVNPFLPFSPYEAEPVPVPWIVGVASLDGLARSGAFVQNLSSLTEYDQNFLYAAPISLFFDTTASNPKEVAKQLREFYFGDRPITMDLFKNLTDMFTDGFFLWPAMKSLWKHKGPHYLYYFDYLGEHSYQEIITGERILTGSSLFDETIYIWHVENPIEISPPSTSQDLCISNLFVRLIYNFASLGEPTPSGFDFSWPRWDSQQQNFINIGNSGVTINSTLFPDRVKFWSQLNYRDKVDKST